MSAHCISVFIIYATTPLYVLLFLSTLRCLTLVKKVQILALTKQII